MFHLSSSFSVKGLLIGLATIALTSCQSGADLFSQGQSSPTPDTTISPVTTAPPKPATTTDIVEQPARCDTTNYYGEVIWQAGQPRMTLVQKYNAVLELSNIKALNNAPATRTVNSDRGLTYTANIEGGVIHTRIYPNANCLIQSVATTGAIVFEEYGRIGGTNAASPPPPVQPAIVPPGPTQQKPQVLPPKPTQQKPQVLPPKPTQQKPQVLPPKPTQQKPQVLPPKPEQSPVPIQPRSVQPQASPTPAIR